MLARRPAHQVVASQGRSRSRRSLVTRGACDWCAVVAMNRSAGSGCMSAASAARAIRAVSGISCTRGIARTCCVQAPTGWPPFNLSRLSRTSRETSQNTIAGIRIRSAPPMASAAAVLRCCGVCVHHTATCVSRAITSSRRTASRRSSRWEPGTLPHRRACHHRRNGAPRESAYVRSPGDLSRGINRATGLPYLLMMIGAPVVAT